MSKEHAYAYEAGYRDGSINYELEHCPACKNVADLQEALAENEKLRELVRHMHTCMEHYEMDGTISCDRCPLNNCVGNCDYERRMRELGVEVDE